jgi:5-formyltetrahydrofolate cyclo-ligase
MPEQTDKQRLRQAGYAARRAMDPARRAAADAAITATATDLARDVACVAAYVPMPGEPGGPGLLDALYHSGALELILPILLPDRDLDWARYDAAAPLIPAAGASSRLREPPGLRLGPEALRRAQLIFVPAVAVDRRGTRLGRGGGSFDLALTRASAGVPVVALLYDGEMHDDPLPAQPHDRPVTAVLTPSGFLPLMS